MVAYLGRLFYLGTQYHGSQVQPQVKTVQGELIEALTKWSGENHSTDTVLLAGRTDRGVHSLAQIVMIETEKTLNIDKINRHLPEDIVIWAHARAPPEFIPRFSVLMRHYRYYANHTSKELDLHAIQLGLQDLIGTNDFALLSKPDGDRATTATVLNACVSGFDDTVTFDFYGTRFLWKLIRKSVTLLLQIGEGEFSPKLISELLRGKDIPGGIDPAPPEGLVLIESVVPVRMKISKYGINRMRSCIQNQIAFMKRYVSTLNSLSGDFLFDQMPPS